MIGLGIGVGWATKRRLVNYINELIKQFKDRVAADGGTFEAQSCLKTTLETLGIVVPPTVITAPVISGSTAIGSVISTTNGVFDGVTPLTYTYQWLLDGSPILGATSSTYTTENLGTLTCKVTATNDFGSANSTSNSLEVTLLLDTYTNASAAYSLRLLRSDYTGSAIRVRRTSDNSETNIGFINNELDTATLETFCSGTDGFVTTWYDQSGNLKNATQTTAANQPQIVISGSVILEGIKPALDFQMFDFMNISATAANGIIGVYKTTSLTDINYIWQQLSPSFNNGFVGGNFAGVNGVGLFTNNTYSMSNNETIYSLGFWSYNGTNYDVSHNGSVLNSLTNTIGLTNLNAIGRSNGLDATQFLSKCNELIFWTNSIYTNKSGIETSINSYYNIY